MEPKENKSVHQSQPPKLHRTIRIPGMSPLPKSSDSGEAQSPPGFWEGLGLPIKWAVAILVPLFILILLGSGLFNLAKGAIWHSQRFANESLTTKQPAAVNPSTEQPITTPSSTNNPTTASSDKNNCTDLPIRMTQSKITAGQVDKLFYQTYPDLLKQRWRERVNKPLSDTTTERNLRQEWCSIANKLIEQKSSK
jgi:hypothetical protein